MLSLNECKRRRTKLQSCSHTLRCSSVVHYGKAEFNLFQLLLWLIFHHGSKIFILQNALVIKIAMNYVENFELPLNM